MNKAAQGTAAKLEVWFKSRGKSGRQWLARFDCGSERANGLSALKVAWKMNATILSSVSV